MTVPAQRVARVADLQPASVRLYDYYNRLDTSRIFYQPVQVEACQICERSDCGWTCGKNGSDSNEIADNLMLSEGSSAAGTRPPSMRLVGLLLMFAMVWKRLSSSERRWTAVACV